MQKKYDLVVIGGGPAGRRGAIQAAKAGKSVLVVEKLRSVGGVCVHTGTIPSKTLRETVLNLSGWRERGFYGKSYKVKADITAQDLQRRLNLTIEHEVEVLNNQFDRNKVEHINGHAKFLSKNEMSITFPDGEVICIAFDKALISVGTRPFRPDYMPFDGKRVLDSDEILEISELPKTLIVIGAGVIGLEYATIFNALDIPVTIIEPRDSVLDFLDKEIVDGFLAELRNRGITLCFGAKAKAVKADANRCYVQLEDGRVTQADMVLFAAGRMGATDQLGLSTCGLDVDHRGRIKVDGGTYQTATPNIYAAGDVIGFPSLASTSMAQGRVAACHAFDIQMTTQPDYFPYGVYSVPEISSIGLTEQDLRKKKIPYQCGIARMRETSRGQIMGIQDGMLKMIFSLETRQLLGVHILGEGATELIHIGQAVLNLGGGLDYFMDNIFNYPTLAEAYKIAAFDAWNRMESIVKASECDTLNPFAGDPDDPLSFMKTA
ncbi:MAG: Si-specific NAD(P)(+) transhydrogenase [Robiginitomaculum sp.]|nr:MAG: Si-specific NAD(P)(+) transhydrogenase [Robiginitomaculum sp.]